MNHLLGPGRIQKESKIFLFFNDPDNTEKVTGSPIAGAPFEPKHLRIHLALILWPT